MDLIRKMNSQIMPKTSILLFSQSHRFTRIGYTPIHAEYTNCHVVRTSKHIDGDDALMGIAGGLRCERRTFVCSFSFTDS